MRIATGDRAVGDTDNDTLRIAVAHNGLSQFLVNRFLCAAVRHKLYTEEEAFAAHITNAVIFLSQLFELAFDCSAKGLGSLRQVVTQHDIKLLQGDRRRQRVRGIRASPWQTTIATHAFGNFRRRYRAAHR